MESQITMKAVYAGGFAALLDQFYLGEEDKMKTLYFASAVAAGHVAAQFVHPLVNELAGVIPSVNRSLYDSKTLAERILEVSTSGGMVYILNKYLLRNDNYKGELFKRMGVIVVSDIAATFALEYFNGRPLEFLHEN